MSLRSSIETWLSSESDWGSNVMLEFENELQKIYSAATNCQNSGDCSVTNNRYRPRDTTLYTISQSYFRISPNSTIFGI